MQHDSSILQPTPELIEDFLFSVSLPSLFPGDLSTLNQPFNAKKIMEVIQVLPHNKSPGPDAFTSEYYQLFHPVLSRHCCARASFPSETLTATIITLLKPRIDSVYAQNFRPISLLNVDLKMYAKLVAFRLLQFLPTLVKPDQVGFVPAARLLTPCGMF